MPAKASTISKYKVAAIAIAVFGLIAGAASILSLLDVFRKTEQDVTQRTAGDFSPNINAQGDVTIEMNVPGKLGNFEYVTEHDGAGAPIMAEPDYARYIRETLTVKRVINGTPVEIVERREVPASNEVPRKMPWILVRVLDGDEKGLEGWTLMTFVKRVN